MNRGVKLSDATLERCARIRELLSDGERKEADLVSALGFEGDRRRRGNYHGQWMNFLCIATRLIPGLYEYKSGRSTVYGINRDIEKRARTQKAAEEEI